MQAAPSPQLRCRRAPDGNAAGQQRHERHCRQQIGDQQDGDSPRSEWFLRLLLPCRDEIGDNRGGNQRKDGQAFQDRDERLATQEDDQAAPPHWLVLRGHLSFGVHVAAVPQECGAKNTV